MTTSQPLATPLKTIVIAGHGWSTLIRNSSFGIYAIGPDLRLGLGVGFDLGCGLGVALGLGVGIASSLALFGWH